MAKEFYLGGVKFIYDCVRMNDCWAYKNGGCAGNHSVCYDAPQHTKEAGEQQATAKGMQAQEDAPATVYRTMVETPVAPERFERNAL
jgi:hypothetical protein